MKRVLILACVAAAAAGLCRADTSADVVTVDQKAFAFSVPELTIKRGTVIRFTNSDAVMHNVVIMGADNTVDSGNQKPGVVVKAGFPDTGMFKVICAIHPRMRMRVIVQ